MKRSLISKLLATLAATAVASAFAGVTPNLVDSNGNPVRDSQGACVQTSSIDHPDCVAKKVEPPKPVEPPPAPKPVEPPPAPKPAEPPPAPTPAPVRTISLQAESLFDFDKYALKPAGKRSIDDAIAKMREANVQSIVLTGHTDSRGTNAYNQKLSERRATTVKNYMVSQGLSAGMITSSGKGETQPVATNKTDEGRAKNRRVDIEFRGVTVK
jgi:OmpA-OmpF porin, OOP family